jgi:integrase
MSPNYLNKISTGTISPIFDINSVRVGVKEHLNRYEIETFSSSKFQYNFIKKPLDYYTEHENLIKIERTYSFVLAFYRRIDLPLTISFPSSVSYKNYPIEELKNFQHFDELFEKYYPDFQKLDSENYEKKFSFKTKVVQAIFKFWLSGFGIAPGYTDNFINDDQIFFLRGIINHKTNKKRYSRVARFLSFVFSKEDFSPINSIPRMLITTNLRTRESEKWEKHLVYHKSEFSLMMYDYVFTNLRDRINKPSVFEYTHHTGELVRISLSAITDGTWVHQSGALLELSKLLYLKGNYTIESALNNGLIDIMSFDIHSLPESLQEHIRITCRQWLEVYTKLNGIKLNINRIIPFGLRNKEKNFGNLINYGSAQTLIQTLLDNDCSYFDETNIIDYRSRRACLIELATGQRASEICILLYKSLLHDKNGTSWLFFHKTKKNKSNKVLATPDIIRWVNELKAVAPSEKIQILTSEYPYGDNLNAYRLLANHFDDGPYTYMSMNRFLKRIQIQLWGTNHPNKRFYSTHDLRRMHALYMRLLGKSKDEIQDQLGHANIDAQLPYLATKPLEHQKWFKKIQLEGIYKNINSEEIASTVEIGEIISKTSQLAFQKYDSKHIIVSLLEAAKDINNYEFPKYSSPKLPTGFPLRLHSCNAGSLVSCGHTELHCFKCKFYMPDIDTFLDHKVEIFRYKVLYFYQQKYCKNIKDLLEREVIQFRSTDLTESINTAIHEVFKKFKLSSIEISDLEVDLESKASKYIKKYYKTNPNPSFIEAKKYLLGDE